MRKEGTRELGTSVFLRPDPSSCLTFGEPTDIMGFILTEK